MQQRDDESDLIWRLSHGDGDALEPLMDRWGDPIAETCFRAVRDPQVALDLYAEIAAETYRRIRYGTGRRPETLEVWVIDVIADVIRAAARVGHVSSEARQRMGLEPVTFTEAELAGLQALRDPREQRDARAALPKKFSAAADRMLLTMPVLSALSSIQLADHESEP